MWHPVQRALKDTHPFLSTTGLLQGWDVASFTLAACNSLSNKLSPRRRHSVAKQSSRAFCWTDSAFADVRPPDLCQKSAADKMLCRRDIHPNWPAVRADVFDHCLRSVLSGRGPAYPGPHTLRPFVSRPSALAQEGRRLVSDVCECMRD